MAANKVTMDNDTLIRYHLWHKAYCELRALPEVDWLAFIAWCRGMEDNAIAEAEYDRAQRLESAGQIGAGHPQPVDCAVSVNPQPERA